MHTKHADILAQLVELQKTCDDSDPYYMGEHIFRADCVLPSNLLLADMMFEKFSGSTIDYSTFPKQVRQARSSEESVVRVVLILRYANHQWIEKMRASKV
ncbi:hypothetical protein EON65_16715 [archaeon]|nr:MAG: hypothetical protein EON65_16715 [archaeon]